MKKYFALLLTAAILVQTTPIFGATAITAFTNYNKNLGYGQLSTHRARNNIETLLNHDGINGYPEGDFRANKEISAAELIAIILNMTEKRGGSDLHEIIDSIKSGTYDSEIKKNVTSEGFITADEWATNTTGGELDLDGFTVLTNGADNPSMYGG